MMPPKVCPGFFVGCNLSLFPLFTLIETDFSTEKNTVVGNFCQLPPIFTTTETAGRGFEFCHSCLFLPKKSAQTIDIASGTVYAHSKKGGK
jgi:hypothetical protein